MMIDKLEFECVGLENDQRFPLEYTGGEKIDPLSSLFTIFHLMQKPSP